MLIYQQDYFGFVYIWRDRKRKMFYIGSHLGSLDDGYIGSNKRLKAAYKKRPNDFKRRILNYTTTNNKNTLFLIEQYWLDFIDFEKLGIHYYNLKNIASGGCGKHTEESRKNISLSKIGKPAPNRGISMKKEQKEKLSKSRTGCKIKNPRTKKYREEISKRQLGKKRKPHTEETKQLMSHKQKGKDRPKINCPYCLMVGEISNMKRWHFNNCKHKLEC